MKKYSLYRSGENSIFITNSMTKSEDFKTLDCSEMKETITIIVFSIHGNDATVLDVTGFNEDERMKIANRAVADRTIGCNYKYDFIKKIGSCYFYE